ncbi:hypothetical protein QTP88_002454 [Uroleucon formosanum]
MRNAGGLTPSTTNDLFLSCTDAASVGRRLQPPSRKRRRKRSKMPLPSSYSERMDEVCSTVIIIQPALCGAKKIHKHQ